MNFSQIIGHANEIEILKKSISADRVAHAYLFSGPDGIGKKLTALSFAAALNCIAFKGDACGVCPSCRLIENGAHSNIISIKPEDGVLKIDAVRDLQGIIKYTVDAGVRVAIVEDVDTMVRGVGSVFLKTLEEPPPSSMIILISSKPASLLPTIISRCQRINFHPLKDREVKEFIMKEKGVSPADAAIISRLSCGSIATAISIIDRELLKKRKEFFDGFFRLNPKDAVGILDFAKGISKDEEIEEIIRFLKSYYRDLLAYNSGCGEMAINCDMMEVFEKGSRYTNESIISSFSFIEEAHKNILPPRYGNKGLVMEALFFQLLS